MNHILLLLPLQRCQVEIFYLPPPPFRGRGIADRFYPALFFLKNLWFQVRGYQIDWPYSRSKRKLSVAEFLLLQIQKLMTDIVIFIAIFCHDSKSISRIFELRFSFNAFFFFASLSSMLMSTQLIR